MQEGFYRNCSLRLEKMKNNRFFPTLLVIFFVTKKVFILKAAFSHVRKFILKKSAIADCIKHILIYLFHISKIRILI